MNSLKLMAILVGALLTNGLTYFGGISPVVAAASTALIFAVFVGIWRLKKAGEYLPLLYMGTFVGMSNLKSLPVMLALLSLVAASAIALVLAKLLATRLIGIGGKLGLIAFAAGIPVMMTHSQPFTGQAAPVDFDTLVIMTAISGFVLMLSGLLRKTVASPVGVSALISLAGALTPYPALIMSASFAGMSSDQNLSGWRLAAIAMVFACLFGLTFTRIEGVGGWLGLLACAAVYLVVVGERVIATIRTPIPEAEEPA